MSSILPILIKRRLGLDLPSKPEGITASGANGFISISWNPPPDGVTDVKVYMSADGGNIFTLLASVGNSDFSLSDRSYNHSGLTNGVTRHYYVVFSNTNGDSPRSSIVQATNNESVTTPGFSTAFATKAEILDSNASVLEVTFNQEINLTTTKGFRLVGCASRISGVFSGSGTTKIRFQLTTPVLPAPDDQGMTFLYWQELGEATSGGQQLAFQSVVVDNLVTAWQGSGNLYYVSATGSDVSGSANNKSNPYRNIQTPLNLAQPGDRVLLKRGDNWSEKPRFSRSGTVSDYIILGAYGNGNKPRVKSPDNNPSIQFTRAYNQIDSLDIRQGGGGAAVEYSGSDSCITSNCDVIAEGSITTGINPGRRNTGTINPIVINNDVSGFWANIRSSGFPLDTDDGTINGTKLHQVYGGLIENNDAHTTRANGDDGLAFQRGDFHNIVLRKNRISEWDDDGIDLFAADNIILEGNTLYSPKNSNANSAIKLGGITVADNVAGVSGGNVICRYNYCYNVDCTTGVINTNNGESGEIYGNVVVGCTVSDVGSGIKVSGPVVSWKIHNNTVVGITGRAFSTYCAGATENILIDSNIFEGSGLDIQCDSRGNANSIGRNNILLGGGSGGDYTGTGDIITETTGDLFENYTGNETGDYRIKAGSDAVSGGVAVTGYTKDHEGKLITDGQIDIGAYELV
jgi:hypothetical protein